MADTAALIEVYRRAQQRIIGAILSSKSVAFNAAMLRTINAELARLQGRTVRWVESQIPEAYREGMRSVNKAYEKAYKAAGEVGPKNYPTEFSKINRRAIQVLVDNTKADFDNALGFVGRQIKDDLRQANLQAIADKLASGTTIEKTRKILAEKYASQGLAAIKYKRAGRDVYMSLEAYAGLVARSTTAEATNTACRNQVEEFGDDLVQMTKHANACPLCISLEGRVYSVSGKHPDYPALDVAYSDGYANIHPNCGHRLVPYIVDLKTPEQIEEDKRISGRSFDIDQWSPAERAQAESNLRAYKAGQAQKRAIYTDRQQWERYKAELGAENVPKTLSGFRRMKGADGDNWKALQAKYRGSAVETKRKAAEEAARKAAETEAKRKAAAEKAAAKKAAAAEAKRKADEAAAAAASKAPKVQYDVAAGIKDYRVRVKPDYDQIASNQGIKDYASAKYKKTVESYSDAVEKACEEGTPCIQIDGGYISSLLDSGRFKSSVELHAIPDAHDRHRILYEKAMFGAPKELDPSQRVIYGHMSHDSVRGWANEYGDVRVNLKRSRIADRTSVYTGDTMAYKGHSPFMLGDKPDVLNIHPGDLKVYKNATEYMGSLDYLELQFHGGVTLEDIDTIWIPTSRYNEYKRAGSKVLKQLDGLGIKWEVIDYG